MKKLIFILLLMPILALAQVERFGTVSTKKVESYNANLTVKANAHKIIEDAFTGIDWLINGSTKMSMDSSGKVGIGTTSPTTQYHSYTTSTTVEPFLVEVDGANVGQKHINLVAYQNGNSNVAPYYMASASKGSKSSPLALASGDVFMSISGEGYNGSAFTGRRARINFATEEAWTLTANGSRMVFETTPNGSTTITERMRIDNAGNVGIGVTPVSEKLDVGGNIRLSGGNKTILFSDPGNFDFSIVHDAGNSLRIMSPEQSASIPIAQFFNNGDLSLPGTASSNSASISRLKFSTDNTGTRWAGVQGFRGTDAANIDLRFFTIAGDGGGVLERMRITNDGRVHLGVGDPTYSDDQFQFSVSGTVTKTGTAHTTSALSNGAIIGWNVRQQASTIAQLAAYKHAGIADASAMVTMRDPAGDMRFLYQLSGTLYLAGGLANVGTVTGVVVGTQTSDERVKSNIQALEYGLDEVVRLKPIRYNRNGKVEIGFGAQTTQPIVPEAVYQTGEKLAGYTQPMLAMDYVRIVPVLVNAVKELKQKNDELKTVICKHFPEEEVCN